MCQNYSSCSCTHSHNTAAKTKRFPQELWRILLAAALWAMAWLFPQGWIELGFFIAAYWVCGSEVLLKSVHNLRHGQFLDENFLMSIATLGAFAIGEYPEAVGVMWFYQIGEFCMKQALHRSRRSVQALLDLTPQIVHLQVGTHWQDVAPQMVQPGQTILVKPGERVPVDGVIMQGESLIDTAALTGESVPVFVQPGQEILSGVIVQNGALELQVIHPFEDSAVSKILELVEHAYAKKTRAERFITRFARWYTPWVVGVAIFTAFVPPLLLPGQALHNWVYRALIFLVISCPCALVLSVPLGFFGGIGAAARRGILIKGSGSLEGLAKGEIIVLDKTGTLTQGVLRVNGIFPQPGFTPKQLLYWAAHAESISTHPVARAICQAYGKPIAAHAVEQHKEQAGQGIWATIENQAVFVGKNTGNWPQNSQATGTQVFITLNEQYIGHISLADQTRQKAISAVAELKKLGFVQTVMLTGDQPAVAERIAQETGVDSFFASLLPADKVQQVERLLQEKTPGKTLLAVGDGINDAPLLARADVGIAMGALGSDAAVEAADVVLVDDKLEKIPLAVRLGRFTLRIIKQNIAFALLVKAVVLLLGALGDATLWEAVFADVGVTVLCVLNSLRPLGYKE